MERGDTSSLWGGVANNREYGGRVPAANSCAQCPLNPSLRFPSSFSVTRLTPTVLSQRSSSDTSSAFTRLPARARFLSVISDLLKYSCAPSSCDRAMAKVSDGSVNM